MIGRRSRNADHVPDAPDQLALDTAWRVHQAQADWTGRVDTKAGFAFTIESAAIATTVILTAKGRLFSVLDEYWLITLYGVGLASLLVAAGFAALVVIPQLRTAKVSVEARHNFIYFGHARLWEPADLETALKEHPLLPQLSRQIVTMARIAWTKHVRVQRSFSLAVIGSACLVACGLLKVT